MSSANHLVLTQMPAEAKSNKITALSELLRGLAVADCVVTIDAMDCQREIAQQILDHEGESFMARPSESTSASRFPQHACEGAHARRDGTTQGYRRARSVPVKRPPLPRHKAVLRAVARECTEQFPSFRHRRQGSFAAACRIHRLPSPCHHPPSSIPGRSVRTPRQGTNLAHLSSNLLTCTAYFLPTRAATGRHRLGRHPPRAEGPVPFSGAPRSRPPLPPAGVRCASPSCPSRPLAAASR